MQTPEELSAEVAKSVAYHEAGHSVIAAVENLALCEAGIHVDSKVNGVAFTLRRNPDDQSDTRADIEQRERSIIMLYAGNIAQEKFCPFSPWEGSLGDGTVAEALLSEMYSPPKSADWCTAQERLWGESYRLVHKHWKAIETLAEALWSKPMVPLVDLGPLSFHSQDSHEKWMSGYEVKALLEPFGILAAVVPNSGGIGTQVRSSFQWRRSETYGTGAKLSRRGVHRLSSGAFQLASHARTSRGRHLFLVRHWR